MMTDVSPWFVRWLYICIELDVLWHGWPRRSKCDEIPTILNRLWNGRGHLKIWFCLIIGWIVYFLLWRALQQKLYCQDFGDVDHLKCITPLVR